MTMISSCIRLPGIAAGIQTNDPAFARHLGKLFDLSPPVSLSESQIVYEAAKAENHWTVSHRDERLYVGGDLDAAIVALYGHLYEWFVPRSQHFLVHAGVVSQGDEAVIFVGAQESGKSTLTSVFVANGWRALSDDVGALDSNVRRVFPYPRHLLLRPETLRRNPYLADALEILHQLDAYGELVFVTRPRRFTQPKPARLSMIVFPRWAQEAYAERLAPAVAAVRLMDNSLNLRFLGYRGVQMASAIARECPAFDLYVKDPMDAVSLVQSIHTA